MSEFAAFLKQNKPARKNEFFPASKDFVDAEGKPIMWELRHLPTIVVNRINSECTKIKGKNKVEFDSELYNRKKVSAAVVYPNLKSAELLDSYMSDYPLDERTPENLIVLMLDDPNEFAALLAKVNEMAGVDTKAMAENIEIAKN